MATGNAARSFAAGSAAADVQNPARTRLQEVGLAKLGDAAASPAFPGIVERIRNPLRVAFQNRHLVPVASQHHCRPRTADSGAEYDHAGHVMLDTRARTNIPELGG